MPAVMHSSYVVHQQLAALLAAAMNIVPVRPQHLQTAPSFSSSLDIFTTAANIIAHAHTLVACCSTCAAKQSLVLLLLQAMAHKQLAS
jgi:hypothetical protein